MGSDESAAARILPEMGIERTRKASRSQLLDFRKRAEALCETTLELASLGMELPEPDELDEDVAQKLVAAYAEDPYETSKQVNDQRASTLTPAALLLAHDVLERFGHQVVRDATRIRHFVTNKLLIEADHKDARIRLRALEMLGKISDVGLFTEKRHITHETVSNDELTTRIREKLRQLDDDITDAEYEHVEEDSPE